MAALALLAGYALACIFVYLAPSLPTAETMHSKELAVPLRIYPRDNQLISQIGEQRRIPGRYEDIPPLVREAVLSAEDDRFFEHHGFDFEQMQQAIDDYRAGEDLRGASTISQQVAKNLFLWSGRSFVRKGLEAYFTVLIEAMWPKRRILEVYLNIAEFGDGVYGAAAASERFFRKTPAQLGAHDSALLAAVLPNPRKYRVNPPTPYVAQRAEWIERQAAQLGGPSYLPK